MHFSFRLITEKAAAIAARVLPVSGPPALRVSPAAVGAAAPTSFLPLVLRLQFLRA